MDPFHEQKLRDEVLYLHSLFYRSPLSNPLPPSNSTKFKKTRKKKNSKPRKFGNFSGKEWPVKSLSDNPPVAQSGWPELKLKSPSQPARVLTPQELEKHNWNLVQQKTLKVSKQFYSKNEESDSDSDDDDDDDMDDDCDDVENKDYEFLWNLFNGDEELKGYYVKYSGGGGGGEFTCLVCGGTNEKLLKKYKDCIALVQHSVSIAKTKRVRSHRAYGKVVCKILGWDINHLPSSIVADHNSTELQGNDANVANKIVDSGELNGNACAISETNVSESMVCEGNDVNVANKIVDSGELNGKACDVSESVAGDSMVCEGNDVGVSNKIIDSGELNGKACDVSETVAGHSMVCKDYSVAANVEKEDNVQQVLNEVEGKQQVVNNLEPILNNGAGSSPKRKVVDDNE